MNSYKNILSILAVGLASAGSLQNLHAQEADYWPVQIGIEGGTTGLGGSVGWRFSDHLGVHGGINYFSYSHDEEIEGINYDAKLKLLSEPLTLDWYPWKERSFRVSIGALFNQNRLSGQGFGNPADTVEIGGDPYGWAAVGPLTIKIKHEPVAPYLSIGGNLFYFDDAHRWAFTGEIGVFYTGDASVELSRNTGAVPLPGIDPSLEREEREIEDEANDFPIWPVVKVGISFSF